MVKIETGNRISIWRTFLYPKRKQLYLSCGLSYNYEIWFADRHGPSKDSDVTKSKTVSKIAPLATAILKIDRTLYLRCGWTDLDEIRQSDVPSTVI